MVSLGAVVGKRVDRSRADERESERAARACQSGRTSFDASSAIHLVTDVFIVC